MDGNAMPEHGIAGGAIPDGHPGRAVRGPSPRPSQPRLLSLSAHRGRTARPEEHHVSTTPSPTTDHRNSAPPAGTTRPPTISQVLLVIAVFAFVAWLLHSGYSPAAALLIAAAAAGIAGITGGSAYILVRVIRAVLPA